MKKIITVVTLIVFFIASSSFEKYTDRLPNIAVLDAFQKQFKNAAEVKWVQKQEVFIANFNLNYCRVTAFFSNEGLLLGTARSILPNQLPLIPMMELNRRFENSFIYDVSEYTVDGALYYVLTVETQTKKSEVKVLPSGEINIRKSKRINRLQGLLSDSIQTSFY